MVEKKKIEKIDESVEEITEVMVELPVVTETVVPAIVVTKRNIHRIPARKNTFV